MKEEGSSRNSCRPLRWVSLLRSEIRNNNKGEAIVMALMVSVNKLQLCENTLLSL